MNEMHTPKPAAPLRALPLQSEPLPVLPLAEPAPSIAPIQINYADAALRKRMSRLSAASCIVGLCALPATIGAIWSVSQSAPQWTEIAGWTTFLATHLTCLVLGLWANSLIRQLKGRVADVVMAGIGIALGAACLGLPLLFFLGLVIMRIYRPRF
jgi:hypothetical protein